MVLFISFSPDRSAVVVAGVIGGVIGVVIGALVLSVGIIICIIFGQYLIKKKNQLDPAIDHELGEKS